MKLLMSAVLCLILMCCNSKHDSELLLGEWTFTNVQKTNGEGWTIYPPLSALPEAIANEYEHYYERINKTEINLKENQILETNLFDATYETKKWKYNSTTKHILLLNYIEDISNSKDNRIVELEGIVKTINETEMIWIVDDLYRLTFKKK